MPRARRMSTRTSIILAVTVAALVVASYLFGAFVGRQAEHASEAPRLARLEERIVALENEAAHLLDLCASN